jgi:uncharacterized repeat protein (TIGR03803 family)
VWRWVSLLFLFHATVCASAAPTLRVLYSFDGTHGRAPYESLIRDDEGALYGTTTAGGANGVGTLFKFEPATQSIATLASFSESPPSGALVRDTDGALYGVASYGGPGDAGTVYKVEPGNPTPVTVATFNDGNGMHPRGGLLRTADGVLYGVTTGDFTPGVPGTIFRFVPHTGALSTLAHFGRTGITDPPNGDLVMDADGNLYGTASNGPASPGTGSDSVFKYAAAQNAILKLGFVATPFTGLVGDTQGNLYGTSYYGGTNGVGSVFKIAAGTDTLTSVASFSLANYPHPLGRLLVDAAGNLFGTTGYSGSVFKVDAATGAIITLAVCDNTTGNWPFGGLVADAEGNLYGTTSQGGVNGGGTIYQISDAGFVVPEPNTIGMVAAVAFLLFPRSRRAAVP